MAKARLNIEDQPDGSIAVQFMFEGEPGTELKESDFNPQSPAHQAVLFLATKGMEQFGAEALGEPELARVVHGQSEHRTPSGILLPPGAEQMAAPTGKLVVLPGREIREADEELSSPTGA